MSEQEDFQVVLSHKDYTNYLSEKQKFKSYESLIAEITQTNQQLQKQVKLLKKSFFIKKAETKYIYDSLKQFINKCNGNLSSIIQENDDDVYQNLIQSNVKGMSSIESYQMSQNFESTYKDLKFQLSKISELLVCTKQFSTRFSKAQEDNEQPIVLKPLEEQVLELNKTLQKLLAQKLIIQKENSIYQERIKTLDKKIQEYEYKMFNNPNNKEQKSYFIKLLLDEYNRQLYQKLGNMNLQRQETEQIILSELNGICQYIHNMTITSTNANNGKKKKDKGKFLKR